MAFIDLISYGSEAFLSFLILYQLCFYIYKIRVLRSNHSVFESEIFWQNFCAFIFIIILYYTFSYECFAFNEILINDFGTRFLKIFFIIVNIYVLSLIRLGTYIQKLWFIEFYILFLIICLAALFLLNCVDLIGIFLLIELQTMCFYLLASFKVDSFESSRAGLKYVLMGAYMSGLYLFGCSLIYGFFGTTNLLNINCLSLIFDTESTILFDSNYNFEIFDSGFIYNFVFFGFFLVLISLIFKLNSAPYHFWATDVYDDAPLSSTIIFSLLPKLIFQILIIRFSNLIIIYFNIFKPLFLLFGLLSLTFGIFYALKQTRLKLLIIFSSISQVGFMLFAISDSFTSIEGNTIGLFFIIVYTLTSLLVWFLIMIENLGSFRLYNFNEIEIKNIIDSEKRYNFIKTLIGDKENLKLFTESEQERLFFLTQYTSNQEVNFGQTYGNKLRILHISDLKNSFFVENYTVISYLIIFFSFAGIPPLVGFLSKFYVILEIFLNDNYLIGFYILLLSAFSSYYYIRIIKLAFFEYKKLKLKLSFDSLKIYWNFPGISLLYILNSIILIFLIITFFNPDLLYLFCEYVIFDLYII